MEETAALVCLILALGYLKMPAGREPAEMQVLAGWQQREGFLQVEKGLMVDRHQLENPVRVWAVRAGEVRRETLFRRKQRDER